ncbi:MAG: N-acetyl-gamma-glutamyl-phosphate reductase [Desulfobacteraceae bacterium 4572_35.1]|nr:MAG: N-acetyl-gamma-glutamyl-phosphate reductase [Desulfobacteraceae bacterium 4572_35.1]
MVKVAVVGASGYAGLELLRLLARHPRVKITSITSRQYVNEDISAVFPSLTDVVSLQCDEVDVKKIAADADVVFTALPHKTSMEIVPDLLGLGCKVVDLSADYRLQDVKVYEQWYQPHANPELLSEAVYGLPELFRENIVNSRLVANPGCYPTSVALALAPLLKHEIIDHRTLIIDSKSGTSGAGRAAKTGSLFCEVNEGFKAYSVASHRHTPEIEQTLSMVANDDVVVNFTPHLLPVNRGILSTCYANLMNSIDISSICALYEKFYIDQPFVRLMPGGQLPNVAYIKGSNYADIGFVVDDRTQRIIVVSAIDNLVKGAAGQAIQNMNIMYGFPEAVGLDIVPLFP